jgi:hypothetical protein
LDWRPRKLPRWVVAAYTAESSRTKERFAENLCYCRASSPQSGTRRALARALRIGPVTSQAGGWSISVVSVVLVGANHGKNLSVRPPSRPRRNHQAWLSGHII